MSLAALNEAAARADTTAYRTADFYCLARQVLKNRGQLLEAAVQVEAAGASRRVSAILRARVQAGGLDSANALSTDYRIASDAFIESLCSFSVFDAMLADGMRKVPLRQRLVIATGATVAQGVTEFQVKPLSTLFIPRARTHP